MFRSVWVAGLALAVWCASRAIAGAAPVGAAGRAWTVGPGETLWQLSARFAPDEDPRQWIFAVERINHLAHATIYPGEVLRLPAV